MSSPTQCRLRTDDGSRQLSEYSRKNAPFAASNWIAETFGGAAGSGAARHDSISARAASSSRSECWPIAGPTGGTPGKPVGTVFIGLSSPSGTRALHFFNPYDRETFKYVTSQQALELLWRTVLNPNDESETSGKAEGLKL